MAKPPPAPVSDILPLLSSITIEAGYTNAACHASRYSSDLTAKYQPYPQAQAADRPMP
jgi:hypothetical protein